jgi:hypothetical protein
MKFSLKSQEEVFAENIRFFWIQKEDLGINFHQNIEIQ